MSSGKIENQLLDAIETVVNNAVAKANYDRTVQAVIVRCENEASGKYTVKYQDSLMYAYSPDLNSIYPNGTPVYVLIPGNDTGLNKQIIGSVSRIGEDYLDNINEENAYEYNGKNCIENSDSFGLCSYTNGGQVIILYDKKSGVNQIGLNTTDAEVYLKTSDYLICGGYVQTNLNLEQQYAGNYGMCFELIFKDNSTGELVTRNYLMDVDQMHGNPYQLNVSTRQSGIFEIDGENFDSINKIYIFEKGFPNIASGKPNDIFISALELYGASLAPKDENANCNLTLLTPQGIYFDDTYLDSDKISLQAQVRAKGSVINPTSETLEYYWFIENNSIVYTSEGYSKIGGAGWECLNLTTDPARKTDWIPSSYIYEITKLSVPARKTRFKCVVCYNKNTYVSREIVIYNYSSPYEITIESSRGTQFYYDLGETNLTCLVNGEDRSSGEYSYVWSVVNNVGSFASLNGSEDYNIDKNKINNLPINIIVNHSTYKCTVFLNGVNIGVGAITINNSLEGGNSYSLIINNGSQVFKYNEQGVSPADSASINPVEILPLGFTLYDNTGEEIPHTAIKGEDIRWIIPREDTMLKVLSAYGEPTFETETTYIYTNTYDMGFSISPTYYSRKLNNTIILEVSYKDNLFIAKTDLTFLKEGESGTNGTEFVCRILPNVAEGDVPRYPMVTYDENAKTYKLNYTAYSSKKWFRVNLWHNGELIYSGTETGTSTETSENNGVSVSWEILRNKYDSTNVDNSNFIINGQTGEITLNPENYISINNDPANIVKCTIRYQGVTYYATLPIIFARVANSDYEIKLKDNTGFIYSMYTTDGRNPQYDNSNPFEIEVYKKGIEITKNSELGYTWFNLGTYYLGKWQPSQNLIERSSAGLEKNQRKYKPSDTNSGLCVSNAVYCTIGNGNVEIGSIHIPIHMYLNRYGNAALNGWDGNSISIDENKGIILSPIVGAGEKNLDNGFTGVLMGTVAEAGAEKTETGLFGYSDGIRTITLSAEDGSARFGSEGAGQIIIDPNDGPEGHAYLRSGNFELAYTKVASTDEYSEFGMYFRKENDNYRLLRKGIDYTPGAQIREPNIYRMAPGGSGLEIDLTDPHIVFGSGDFRVDSDGRVYASQYATANMSFGSSSVVGLDSKLESVDNSISDLQNSINYLDVTMPATAIQIETDTERKPVKSNTYTLECVSLYKGEVVQPTRVNSTGSYQGISLVSTAYDSSRGATIITFYVDSKTALENAINTYEFEFIYNKPGCKPVKKEISINAVIKGADGTSVTIKGSYTNITDLCTNKSSGNQPGDGYILEDNSVPPTGEGEDGHLFIYTNAGGGNGSLPEDWRDVGKFRGQDGVNGRGIQAITYTYLVNNSSIKPDVDDTGWRSVMDVPDENNRYLWQKEVITYLESNGTATTQTTILLLTVYGKTGTGVKSTEIKYQESVSGTVIPSEDGWVDNPPEVPSGHYLWSRIKVSYTDNRNPDISYTIAYSGTNGEDSTNIACGNEADSIACGNDEKTSAASTITIPFEGYVGKRKVACTVAATGLPTGITVKTNTAATSTTRGSLVLNVASGSTLGGTKSGTITLTFTCNNLTFIKYFTWFKVIKGDIGLSPYIGYLTNESHTFAYGTAKDVTTQLYAYQGTTEKAVTIKTVNGKAATTTTAETGKTGMNFKVSSTGSVSHPTITFSSTSSLPQTQSEQLNIVYRIAGESVDRTLSFSYSTTTQGAGGVAASLVDITASSQVFKSNDGGRTFSPNVITLTPRFQTVAYSKWQYSTNGGSSWIDVLSGSHGLTISNQILTVANNSDLYTTTTSSVIFRCMSNNTSIFDTLSIVRLYDVGDIQIGGCNLARETKSFEVGEDLWSIGPGFTKDIDNEGFTTISFSRTGSTTSTWTRAIPHKYLTINEINNYAKNGITVSFDLKVENKDVVDQGVLCSLQIYQDETTRLGRYENADIITGAQYDEPLSAWTNGIWKRAKVHFSLENLKQINVSGKTENDISFTNVSFQLVKNGSISIRKVKIEYGNTATDWTPAPEDVDNDIGDAQVAANNASGNATTALEGIGTLNNQVITINGQLAGLEGLTSDLKSDIDRNYANSIKETYVEYCQINYTFSPIAANTAYNEAEVYYQRGGSTSADYVYSKIRPTIKDGKIQTACYIKVSPLRQPNNDDVWNRSKPIWRDGTGTYQRTTVVYQNGTADHSTPFLTEDYQTVDDLRYIDASGILADMRGKNNIFYNADGFYCYDVNNEEDSKHRIILNHEGILFGVKEGSVWKDTSVWGINGVFNAKTIEVNDLNAESITDGILTLGNTSKDGELRIQDDAGANRIELNSQRAIYYLNNGGYVLIGKDIGIQVLDADNQIQFGSSLTWTAVSSGNYQNNINYYRTQGNLMSLITPEPTGTISETVYTAVSENIFEVKQQKVSTSINFGDLIQTININASDSAGRLHKGVGFVAKL